MADSEYIQQRSLSRSSISDNDELSSELLISYLPLVNIHGDSQLLGVSRTLFLWIAYADIKWRLLQCKVIWTNVPYERKVRKQAVKSSGQRGLSFPD